MQCMTTEHPRSYECHVGGLKRFIQDANVSGINRFDLVQPIFGDLKGSLEPKAVDPFVSMGKAQRAKKWNDEKRKKNYVMEQLRKVPLEVA